MVTIPRPLLVVSALCAAFLSGCTTYQTCGQVSGSAVSASCAPIVTPCTTCSGYVEPRSPIVASCATCNTQIESRASQSVRLRAVGYGSPGNHSQYTPSQQKLMAMRAAQVDAYRNLAEQVQGFRISGSTAVSAFAIQNDTIRSYVDSFIRGARVVSTTSIADGNFQVEVELDITNQFTDCLTNFNVCNTPSQFNSCVTAGCTVNIPAQVRF